MAEAKALYREVAPGFTAHCGPQDVWTLRSKANLANLLMGEDTAEAKLQAKALYLEVVVGWTAQYGAQHKQTLLSKMGLAAALAHEAKMKRH